MKRIIDFYLNEWKNSAYRKPLLLRGARQVGKTYAVKNLGNSFRDFVNINFEQYPKVQDIFEQDLNPHRIIMELSKLVGKDIFPKHTLLFLDEIQRAPKAVTALRYFYEEIPDLHVIAAGSLLDFSLPEGMPVGRIESLYMYPMTFLEFLGAKNETLAINEIINHDIQEPINDNLHNKFLKLLGEYIAIGGLPEAIKIWVETQDFYECSKIHQNLIKTYQDDFPKYAKKLQIKYLDVLFNSIGNQIAKKFKFSNVPGNYKKRELLPALDLLQTAGIVHKIYKSAAQGLPLGAQADYDDFKIMLIDVAITQAILGLELGPWLQNPLGQFINKGELIEALIGQEIIAYSNPIDKGKIYYWRKETKASEAEVDYIIQERGDIIPIEVKSGEGTRLKSIQMFLEMHKNSNYGIRFSTHNLLNS